MTGERLDERGPGLVAVAALVSSTLLCWIGVARYGRGEYGNYDLGIFLQAADSWTARGYPYSELKDINLLGDHFSPVTLVFAAAHALWPDPRSLILAQALCLGALVGCVVWAAGRAGLSPGLSAVVATVATLCLPVIAAAGFQVHETALGAPVVAVLAWSVWQRSLLPAVVSALLLLTVKEDLGLMVVGAAIAWFHLHRDRRTALWLAAIGSSGFVLSNLVIVLVNPGHQSPYLKYLTGGASGGGGGWTAQEVAARAIPWIVYALLCGLRLSPLHLMALPSLAWRSLSSNELYWSVHLHYDVITAPIALVVLVHALGRVDLRRPAGFVVMVAMALSAAWGTSRMLTTQQPWTWDGRLSDRQVGARALAEQVPDGSVVVADQYLGPDLVSTHRVRMLSQSHDATGRYVLLESGRDTLAAPACAKYIFIDRHHVAARSGDLVLVDLGRVQKFRLPTCPVS